MTLDQVLNLRHGDQVFYNDPDQGLCSGLLVIGDISVNVETLVISITDMMGNDIQCYPDELS